MTVRLVPSVNAAAGIVAPCPIPPGHGAHDIDGALPLSTNRASCPDVNPQLVHIRSVWLLIWVSTCTCGRYRRVHLRWDRAMRHAEIHEITHYQPSA